MEMDCNLKKLANFFKFLLIILGNLLKKLNLVYSSSEKSFHIFSLCCKSNFILEKRFCVKYLDTFNQHTAKSP